MRDRIRQLLRTKVMPKRGIRRAHIIGCARSGTTMLHYAMAAFENVSLHRIESDIRYTPSITQSLHLCSRPAGSWLVTKREFGWFEPETVEDIIKFIQIENIALINVVRDPRDVLVSRHAGHSSKGYYVDPERWHKSILAGQEIVDAVSAHVPTLTLRYEDIVMRSDDVEEQLINELGFIKNSLLSSISQLEDNIASIGASTTPWMKRAMHSVRNFDQNSVGRWQEDDIKRRYLHKLLNERSELQQAMVEFMIRHGYEYSPIDSTAPANKDATSLEASNQN